MAETPQDEALDTSKQYKSERRLGGDGAGEIVEAEEAAGEEAGGEEDRAPTQTIRLTKADRVNMMRHLLPPRGKDKVMSRAIARLRRRLEFDGEVELKWHVDGTCSHAENEPHRVPYELTDGEVELLAIGQELLEENEAYPTASAFLELDDRVDELVKTTRKRDEA